ncbi:MAG: response regulator, partial [Candidatus Binatia bacterium]
VKAVIELASFREFNAMHEMFLDQLTESIGIVINTFEANTRTEDLLKQSQSLAGELQSQQEELRQTNQKLEEKATLLAEQNAEVERKNREVEHARRALEEKAEQLALTSKYKSEFLANMSHELRTPLNSLLILSDQLSKNSDGNLRPRQVEFAKTIHSSGNDLLTLINDILDLSKIESGTVVIEVRELRIADLRDFVERTFRHVADSKALEFSIELDPALARGIHTDPKRLQQVIKNLLSNAFKFTERGGVALSVAPATRGWSDDNETLGRARSVVAISVRDTGIGIPAEKQHIIFEAFQQADGSTSRKFGGTGLGLAISREITRLLGGEIRVESEPGAGSTFTLFLPQSYVAPRSARRSSIPVIETRSVPAVAEAESVDALPPPSEAIDDRERIEPGDRVLLIVDNDESFARYLLDLARELGMKGLVAASGVAAVTLAHEYHPDAITLDIRLPDIDGWRVLDRLKSDLETRHVPVHIISTDEDGRRGLALGAVEAIAKPIRSREILDEVFAGIRRSIESRPKTLLVAVADGEVRRRIVGWMNEAGVEAAPVATAAEAVAGLEANPLGFGCAVLDPFLPEGGGLDLAERIAGPTSTRKLPVILYAPRDLSKKEEAQLKRLAATGPVKEVKSLERLLDQAALFLHLPSASLPPEKREVIEKLHRSESVLAGKRALIVDDDIRNIFALTSVLEKQKMTVLSAETGKAAIETLHRIPGIDVVLMDIMMPDMDGYETMRAIRRSAKFRSLPIIAVTAKAMKGDREKTIEAGAWDYLSKPVDTDQMLSVLRAWLCR